VTVDDQPDPQVLWRWVRDALRPWAGWGFVALGALLVLLGYFGVSREAIVEKQLPYVVSGGIGGLLLCILGAYFLATEELRRDSGRLDRLEQMVQELHGVLLARADAPRANGHRLTAVDLLVVDGGTSYHRPGCPLVDGKETTAADAAAVDGGRLVACPLCEPVTAPAG
jgi:hypothetical protein